jgi:hypothetical protein
VAGNDPSLVFVGNEVRHHAASPAEKFPSRLSG